MLKVLNGGKTYDELMHSLSCGSHKVVYEQDTRHQEYQQYWQLYRQGQRNNKFILEETV